MLDGMNPQYPQSKKCPHHACDYHFPIVIDIHVSGCDSAEKSTVAVALGIDSFLAT